MTTPAHAPATNVFPNGARLATIPTLAEWASVSRTVLYEHIKQGRLKICKINRSTRVAYEDAEAWIKGLRN